MLIQTKRLRLRDWRDTDVGAFGVLNADPEVANWLSGPLTEAQNLAMIGRLRDRARESGFTIWALETLRGDFLGACGLIPVAADLPVRPGVEIGWRLARAHWGLGYATEAAKAVLSHAWSLGLPEVLSFTARTNTRSRGVMERIGMTHEPDCDFAHPRLSPGHPLLDHLLYSIRRPA